MRITIIGSGNVATHLAVAFKNAGHRIVQVYSRDVQHAALLAYHVNAEPISDFSQIDENTGLFVIAVKDDAIPGIAGALTPYRKLTVHTSGAAGLNELSAHHPSAGVFYPLQTFSKNRELDFRAVPLCIEGTDDAITSTLVELGQTISNQVHVVDSEQRRILHLAAVFACNFPNYLYDAANRLLEKHNLDFGLLRPLILETAQKVQDNLPRDVQTGPAVRNDVKTMEAHLNLLDDEQEAQLKLIYGLLSQGIIKNHNSGH